MARRCSVHTRSVTCRLPAVTGSPNCRHHGGVTPPVLVGLACGDQGRYSDFIPNLVGLHKPVGSAFKKVSTLGPAHGWNIIAQTFLDRPEFKYLFLTNDDNLCPPDTIYKLMDRDVDVVSGLYFGRIMPFEPILFDKYTWESPEDPAKHDILCTIRIPSRKCNCAVRRKWWHRHLMKPGESGLISAAAVGDGCLLIKRHVLECIPPPWWEYGVTMTDVCDHDVKFSEKVIKAGFGLYCDLDVVVGHITPFTIEPLREADGTWNVKLKQDDEGRHIILPAAHKGGHE